MESYINILGLGITNSAIMELLNIHNILCKVYDDKFTHTYKDSKGNEFAPFYSLEKFFEKNTQNNHIHRTENPKRESKQYQALNTQPQALQHDDTLAIISPGIPPNTAFLAYFTNIMSEYDFIYNLLNKKNKNFFSIWISGTNGKTTTTEMTSLMLQAKSGGNIGTPLAKLFMQDFPYMNLSLESLPKVCNHNIFLQDSKEQITFNPTHSVFDVNDFQSHLSSRDSESLMAQNQCKKNKTNQIQWVLETSSFALHYTNFALPNLYILLPLSQDHISWHTSFESYLTDKLKPLVLMNLAKNPKKYYACIPKELLEHEIVRSIIESFQGNLLLYADSNELQTFLNYTEEYQNLFKEPFKLDFMLSAAALQFADIAFDKTYIKQYKIGHYRMEEKWLNNILFVNDSKGTNPHAVFAALSAYRTYRIYLILGGDAKGAKLDMLYPIISTHGTKVFSIGKDGTMIARECKQHNIFVKECHTLSYALNEIAQELRKDNLCKDSLMNENEKENAPLVMLSPACASLDQYKSYKARGDEFNELVIKIFGDFHK
ncbi:UDP-N-acetylmuramoylalanine--D-glutamate ligase [Helicobacter didelphidarum]|uniref:UDP-N-acetylmuramoylalanine--D-glutamate ligase n=1 Tax=Helicobacter didelphidarum TaxID=2040648 RepID=A0A3D8IK40_9HELI|nr:Mur ligase family protein [Helicobacter didelphidarum]RDU64931.1 UDP-N-acetylmuramoylalanine--D-glutamate ligase [Helicobacter didelphidarum]